MSDSLLGLDIALLLHVQRAKIDRLKEEGRGEAAVGGRIGDDAASEREEIARAFDEQGRFNHLFRNIAKLEQAAIEQFDGEHGAFGGGGLDRQFDVDFEQAIRTTLGAHFDAEIDFRTRIHAQRIRRAGIFEREIADELRQDLHLRGGRLFGSEGVRHKTGSGNSSCQGAITAARTCVEMRLSDKKILSNQTKSSVSLNLSYIVSVSGASKAPKTYRPAENQKRLPVNTQVIALIVFAVLAVVILLQLYNVLGRKMGFRPEEKPAGPKGEELDAAVRAERVPEAMRMPNLETLKTRDTNFNEINFLEKARETYEQVVVAFHKGELDTIRDRLSERVMNSFSQAVGQRAGAPKDTVSFVDTPKADLDLIDFKEDLAQIRVRFLSELAYEDVVVPDNTNDIAETTEAAVPVTTPDKKAEPVKPHRAYKRTAEYWTFQKAMKNPASPWLLTKVEAAKA